MLLPPPLNVKVNDDESIVSLKVIVIAEVIATLVALFEGLTDLTSGAVVSVDAIIMSNDTGVPSRFVVVEPLYIIAPDASFASTRKYLSFPLRIEKLSVIVVCPATRISFCIVVISEAAIVKEIL